MEQGFDPEVKQLFRKIVRTASLFLGWLILIATVGIYFRVGYDRYYPAWLIVTFYILSLASLLLLLRYVIRLWKN